MREINEDRERNRVNICCNYSFNDDHVSVHISDNQYECRDRNESTHKRASRFESGHGGIEECRHIDD